MDTYEKLVETVADWLGRNDLAHRIPDFIHLAEVDLSRNLKLRDQEKIKKGTLVADQEWIPLPDDLQIARQLKIHSDPVRLIEIVSVDKLRVIEEAYTSETGPMAGTHVGNRL